MAELISAIVIVCVIIVAVGMNTRAGRMLRRVRRELQASRARNREIISFMNLFTRKLATVADVESAMAVVAHYLADILNAEALVIYAVQKDQKMKQRQLKRIAVQGKFPMADLHLPLPGGDDQGMIQIGEGLVGKVAQTQKGLLLDPDRPEFEGFRLNKAISSLIAMPMYADNRLTGVICAVNSRRTDGRFNEDDLEMLEGISYQAALAVNLVSVYSVRSAQERLLQELDLARYIQQSLLPQQISSWGGYRLHAETRPALEVAGDFYDFIQIDENRLMIVIADATGKGVPACMLVSMCRSYLHSLSERYTGLGPLLHDLNRLMFEDTDRSLFLTMGVVVIDKKTHVCEYASAGHTELLVRLANGTVRCITPDGPALGLLPNDLSIDFDTFSFLYEKGCSLMLFTDGLVDAHNTQDQAFGNEALEKLWREAAGANADEFAGIVFSKLKEFTGEAAQYDDQTLVIIERVDD